MECKNSVFAAKTELEFIPELLWRGTPEDLKSKYLIQLILQGLVPIFYRHQPLHNQRQ